MRTILIVLGLVVLSVGCYSNDVGGTELDVPVPPYDVSVYDEDLDYAQVMLVKATTSSEGSWRFDVTVRHRDEGWDHYADLWEVVDPSTGAVIAQRVLAHPHDTEQPFTRSQSGIEIPEGLGAVMVRAKCTVHGYGGKAVLVDLTAPAGDGFEVRTPAGQGGV